MLRVAITCGLRTRCMASCCEVKYVTKLYRKLLPIHAMGVTASISKRAQREIPRASFASFSTTGTLTSSVDHEGSSGLVDSVKMIEVIVGDYDHMQDGMMKTIELGDGKALLVRENGEYFAVGHKCTHYGAPLITGDLCNGRVRCPWHLACFNIRTGDIEDFPGLDSLPKFEVVIKDGNVVVRAHPEQLTSHKRVKKLAKLNEGYDKRVFVVVGGGGGAMKGAETLREEGFQGRVIMVTKELHLPYDRPMLSKKLAASADSLKLRSQEYLKDCGIEFLSQTEATALDANKKTITLSNGSVLNYDCVLIATGGQPRSLNVPGKDLENIFVLRSPDDANKIESLIPGKNVVVIGTSFIGMELVAFLTGKAASVTCVGRSETPFANVLGKRIGKMLRELHEKKGVKFITNAAVKEFKGENGKLKAVLFDDGREIPADICLQGIGVTPSTDFLKDSGVPLTSKGEVLVNKYMQACDGTELIDGVYAAGDIAHFPLKMNNWDRVTIGHWQIAHKHGQTAARNMLGRKEDLNTVPFFWTFQHSKPIRYCGHAESFDDIIYDGNVEEQKFVAYYVKGDRVLAVATMGPGNDAAKAGNLFFENKMPTATEIRAKLRNVTKEQKA